MKHQLIIRTKTSQIQTDLATFDCSNRYTPTKEQRAQINALKYEYGEITIIKRREQEK